MQAFYERGEERDRLATWAWLEFARTQELLLRHLPPPPARVLDVGGGPGAYAAWLAGLGYDVHLVDPVPLHVEQAHAVANETGARFTAAVGDARRLAEEESSFAAVLLLGPLYHLVRRDDRIAALSEARRVAVEGAVIAVAAISRFASIIDGLARGLLLHPEFKSIVEKDLRSGEHRNPTDLPRAFTTSFFHKPEQLAAELDEAGLDVVAVYGVEGPAGWFAPPVPPAGDSAERDRLLWVARAVEEEPALLGSSAHLLAIGQS
jgi:ubiquinone/menaquinone biosynthesis C-methylase UbiE